MIRPILDEIVRKISSVRRLIPIIYLVSEDREILFDLFRRSDCFDIRRQTEDGQIVPCAYSRHTEGLNVIPATSPRVFSDPPRLGAAAHKNNFQGKTRYYYVRDFAALDNQEDYFTQYIKRIDALEEGPLSENLIIVSPAAPYQCIPSGFEQFVEVIDVPMIGLWEIAELAAEAQNRALKVMDRPLLLPEDFLKDASTSLEKFKGLNRQQVRHALRQLEEKFGWISPLGLTAQEQRLFPSAAFESAAGRMIYEQKRQSVRKDGAIDFLPTAHLEKPGGMEGLCEWIVQKKKILEDPANARQRAETFPRGILIAGLPGSGKSMTAKYIAHELNDMPLIQFKFSRILTGVVGGTEEKLDRALKLIEAVAPCVVWIDEIEKELSGTQSSGESDAGVASRCLATLLNWMQENQNQCFICATANHIETLPAELLRRGRFDRKYYTFLPMHMQCVEILVGHLRQIAAKAPDLFSRELQNHFTELGDALFDEISKMDRKFFTGADIEGLIQDAKSLLFQRDEPLPYSYKVFKEALIQTAHRSQPYGETNFQEVLEYWSALRDHPFLNAAVPEALRNQQDRYQYMLFDFSDFTYTGDRWTWKDMPPCASPHPYDKNMYDALKSGILAFKNDSSKK